MWPPIGKVAARSAYDVFLVTDCLIQFFPHLGFWSGKFFLIALFPDHCLPLPFYTFQSVMLRWLHRLHTGEARPGCKILRSL